MPRFHTPPTKVKSTSTCTWQTFHSYASFLTRIFPDRYLRSNVSHCHKMRHEIVRTPYRTSRTLSTMFLYPCTGLKIHDYMFIFLLFQKLCFSLIPRLCNRTRCGFVICMKTFETERFTRRGRTRDNLTRSFFFNTHDSAGTIRTPHHFITMMFHKVKYHHSLISLQQFISQQGSHK